MKYNSVWIIEGYGITKCGKVISKYGTVLKRTVKGYTIGYWINGKFRSLDWINKNCNKITDIICPF